MLEHTGPARVFDREEDAVRAVVDGEIVPGDVVVVRYQGRAPPACRRCSSCRSSSHPTPALAFTTALITDGRFSGRQPRTVHRLRVPEAIDGGPLAFVAEGDLIEIDIPKRTMNLVGVDERVLALRRAAWTRPKTAHRGALGHYTALAEPRPPRRTDAHELTTAAPR